MMRKAAIILFVIQILAVLGGAVSGNLANVFNGGIPKMIGYFFPAILGVILYVIGSKKKED